MITNLIHLQILIQDGPLPKICLVLAFLAQDILSGDLEVQFSPCPVTLASLVLKLGLLELLNLFCTSCSKKVYQLEYCNTINTNLMYRSDFADAHY